MLVLVLDITQVNYKFTVLLFMFYRTCLFKTLLSIAALFNYTFIYLQIFCLHFAALAHEVVSETIVDEVVEFEEWMVDPVSLSRRTGVAITLSGSLFNGNNGSTDSIGNSASLLLLLHPQILGR